jgi:hypothetical protein
MRFHRRSSGHDRRITRLRSRWLLRTSIGAGPGTPPSALKHVLPLAAQNGQGGHRIDGDSQTRRSLVSQRHGRGAATLTGPGSLATNSAAGNSKARLTFARQQAKTPATLAPHRSMRLRDRDEGPRRWSDSSDF